MTTDSMEKMPTLRFELRRLSRAVISFLVLVALLMVFSGWLLSIPELVGWGLLLLALDYVLFSVAVMIRGIGGRSPLWFVCGMLLMLSCIVLAPTGALLLPALQGARNAFLRSLCKDNMQKIVLAMQQYHTDHGSYPPPFIADANGNPLHSWRVLLLPYLEQKALHSQYRFDEPWDGQNNRKLHNTVVKIFACPAQGKKRSNTETNYVAIIGPKTVWPGGNSHFRDADLIDGLSNTLMLVEVADSGIHWMEPRDLHLDQMPSTINSPRGQGISSHHTGGANTAFADGGVRFLTNGIPPETIRAALTVNGKESPPLLLTPRP